MKVAILAGGLGTRMREETEYKPKPMVEIGGKPVLWHIMKHFSHHGINDFVILGGYKISTIKSYFSEFAHQVSDVTFDLKSRQVHLESEDSVPPWNVTILDTGPLTETGGRLYKARKYLQDEDFICTYGDTVADVDVTGLLTTHRKLGTRATITMARPRSRFGVVELEGNKVIGFKEKPMLDDYVNIGFMVFSPEMLMLLSEETVLEKDLLPRLAGESQVSGFFHTGFWEPMDTYREYKELSNLWSSGQAPWKSW